MQLWLVCFLILFFGAETAQWLGQSSWMGGIELSLPLTIVAGIGLAIASNYRRWPSVGTFSAKPEASPLPSPPLPPSPPVTAPVPPAKASRKESTISFEIKKPQGKG